MKYGEAWKHSLQEFHSLSAPSRERAAQPLPFVRTKACFVVELKEYRRSGLSAYPQNVWNQRLM